MWMILRTRELNWNTSLWSFFILAILSMMISHHRDVLIDRMDVEYDLVCDGKVDKYSTNDIISEL